MTQTKKTVFVTGAGQGIGLAICRRLANGGNRVVMIDRNDQPLKAAAEDLLKQGLDVRPVAADVTDRDAMVAILDAEERVDVVVTAAGVYSDCALPDLREEDFRFMMEVNLIGTFIIAQEAAARMQPGGRIVTISSRGALGGTRFAHYVSSKAAVIGLTRAMAMELRDRQITVNSIAPGFTDTPMTRSAPKEMFEAWENLEPSGRAASPDHIASSVAYLASEDAAFVTGQCLFVDGGKSLGGLNI